jgi:hypothetical protein
MAEELSASAIREIQKLTLATMRVQFEKRPGDPDHIVHKIGPDGSCELQHTDPEPLAIRLASPAAFIEYVVAAHGEAPQADKSLLCFNESGLVYYHDAIARLDQATCNLPKTQHLLWLEQYGGKQIIPHVEFIRTLRINFRGCIEGPLLDVVRNLRWENSGQNVANIQHGKESMGKAITQQVLGTETIPEEVNLHVPMFENWDHRERITAAVEIIHQSQAFRLTPFPGELSDAMDRTMQALRDMLEGQKLTPFHGHA